MSDKAAADKLPFPARPVLVVVDAFIDSEHEEEFNKRYEEHNLPLSVGCPGFLGGARYVSSDDKERKYTAHYVIEDESAMETPELDKIRGFGPLQPYVRYERRLFRPISSFSKATGSLEHY